MRQFAAFLRTGHSGWPTLAVAATALVAHCLELDASFDHRLHDVFVRAAPGSPPAPSRLLPDATVVTLDPRSLRALGDWPWPRSRYAEAVERLSDAGAAAIAFDIDFSAASRSEDDARFAASLAGFGKAVLATFSQTETMEGGLALEVVNRPIEKLDAAAASLGNVVVPIEADGIVRRVPDARRIADVAVPSLARAALALAAPPQLRAAIESPAAGTTNELLDYRRFHPPIATLAFADLLEGRFDPALVAGRAIFVGATAAEFQDLWATPVDPALPGVYVQAIAYRTAVAALAEESTVAPASLPLAAAVCLLVAGLLHPGRQRGHWARALLFSGAALSILGAGWIALWWGGVSIPASALLAIVVAQYVLGIEGLERHVRRLADARASSLDALARVGDLTREVATAHDGEARPEASLEIALQLLGDVVAARGVVLIRTDARGEPTDRRLEWRPRASEPVAPDAPPPALVVDLGSARRALAERQMVDEADAGLPDARVVYAPLAAGVERVGVLVVFCRAGERLDPLARRTIATVGAQLALTAQNLRLIERLRETFESSIAAVASAVEARDGYTDQHCRRLAAFSSLMGARLGMPAAEIRAMELGALLHDVGKIGIRDNVLNKPDRLTAEERREMERHPEIGAGIVAPVVGLQPTTLDCILHHHECWDGTGYPEGLVGEEIPLAARIVTIVDVWDALSTARPYKAAFPQAEVRDLLRKGAGTRYDPQLVDLFFQILDEQGDEMLALVARTAGQEAPR